jgi:hypothetical protein
MNPFDALGIPQSDGLNFVSLGYCVVAEACVVSLIAVAGASIYVRERTESKYRNVVAPNGCGMDVRVVVASGVPKAYTMLHEGGGGDIAGLGVIALPSGECSRTLPRLDGHDDQRVWVSEIVGINELREHSVLVKVGIAPSRPKQSFRVRYCICAMCPETGHLSELVELTTPFG